MQKKTSDFKKDIERALRATARYSKGLDFQITALAGAMRTLAIANAEIDELESTTIDVVSRYGNETKAPHPVFKTQKDAQEMITKMMKALSLTAEDLSGAVDDDPLIDLTKKVAKAGNKAAAIIKPE